MKTILFFLCLLCYTSSFAQKANGSFLLSYRNSSSGEDLYGYKDRRGKIVISVKYFSANDTMYTIGLVCTSDGYVYINRKGRILANAFAWYGIGDPIKGNVFIPLLVKK